MCSHILDIKSLSFQGTKGRTNFHCAMKEIYEMPQVTVAEMELGCPVMDGTGGGSGDDIPVIPE